MRIISGHLKGRRLTSPKQLPVRPTTDRAKEALFNILNHYFDWDEITALDLFSGTGNIAYELASRGVPEVTAVDQNSHCTRFIYKTTNQLELPIKVVKQAVLPFLEKTPLQVDFVFADPPYAFSTQELDALIEKVTGGSLLRPDGVFVLEHDKHKTLTPRENCLETRRYGNSSFAFYSKK